MASPKVDVGGAAEEGKCDAPESPAAMERSEPSSRQCAGEGVEASRKVFAGLLAVTAGALLVTQNGVNTNLRLEVTNEEPFQAALISFSIGLVSISIVALVHSPRLGATTVRKARWYSYLGGLLGPVYVVATVLLAKQIGFAAYQLCVITGQLLSSCMCDAIGFLGLPIRRPSALRIAALFCTFVGAALTAAGAEMDGEVWELVLYCFASAIAGAIFPVQAAINGSMQKHVLTPFRAVFVSFAGGVMILVLICTAEVAFAGKSVHIQTGEPWMFLGGVLGACLVTCNVIGVPAIGAASFTTLFLASQLFTAFIFDLAGAFGFETREVSMLRVAGVALAILASIAFQLAPSRLVSKQEPSVATVPKQRGSATSTATAAEGIEQSDDIVNDASKRNEMPGAANV